jgi:tetratricopeptide (TPR) repeat protein
MVFVRVTLLLIFVFAGFASAGFSQQGLPPLDFDKFRKDVASLDSPLEKLDRYVEMSLHAVRYKPDSLFVFAEEIRNLPGLDTPRQQAFESFILANAWRPFNRDSSIHYGTIAAERLKRLGEHSEYLRTQNLLGLEYRRKLDYLSAEAAYLEGVSYSQSIDSAGYPIHYFYGNLGNLYSAVGAHDLAVQMFEEFMEYEDTPADRCNVLSRLVSNLMEMNALKKAEETLAPCLNYPNLPPPIKSIVRSNMSEIVGKRGQNDRSLALLEEAASISVRYRIPNLHIAHLIRLGNYYLDRSRERQADSIRVLMERTSFRGINQHFSIERALFLADLALAKGDHKEAIAYADSAIQTATKAKLEHFLEDVYKTKAKAYEHLGELDEAVENLRLHDTLREQLKNREEEKNLAMMQVRYQLQKNEEKLAKINQQLTLVGTKNSMLVGLVLSVALITGFLYYRYRRSRKNELTVSSELQKKDARISKLEKKIDEQNQKLKASNIPEWVSLNSQVKLSLDKIRYIQSEGNYVRIYISDSSRAPMMERMTLKQCQEILPEEIFLRIHRSTIVNIRHISHISNELLYLKDDTELKISRRYKTGVTDMLS